MKKLRFTLALLGLPCTTLADTVAQQEPGLEIIEVRAQKRLQDINDVALSVRHIDGRTLTEQNLHNTTDLSAQAVNFKITQNAAEGTPPAVNIRGVGSLDYNTSTTSPVGIYLDDVAGGSANAQLINLFDTESVEILRGPQGTLFGRNTTGGAILIRSKRPEQSAGGYLSAGLGQQNMQRLEGAYNLPINDNWASRLAVSHNDYDYSVNNLHPQAPQAGMRQNAARLSIAGEVKDLTVFAKIHTQQWDGIVKPVGNLGMINSETGGLCTPEQVGSSFCTDAFGFNDGSDDFYDIDVNNDINQNSPHTTDAWGVDIHLDYKIDSKRQLTSISSYNKLDRVHFFNSDGSPARWAEGGQDVYTRTYTQELRYQQELGQHHLITGLYYLQEELAQDNFIDLFRDLRDIPVQFSNAASFFYDNQIDTSVWAAFAHMDYQLWDNTTLSAGVRYNSEDIDYRAIGHINVPTSQGDQQGILVPGWDVSGEVSDNNWSGKLALQHKWSRNFNGFISYARGFKSGGYNGAIITSAEEAARNHYGAESLNALELGTRYYWDNQNAALYTAIFSYDYQDQQVFMNQAAVSPNAPPIQLLSNVGKSSIYGAEAELTWQLTSSLNLQFGAGYLPEAKLHRFVDASGKVIENNRLPFTSEWNLTGLIRYHVPWRQGEWQLQLDFDYQSEFYFDQNQNPYTRQGGYTLLNAHIAYEWQQWQLALWGKNIADKEYSHLRFDLSGLLGMSQDFKGESRQWGVDLAYHF